MSFYEFVWRVIDEKPGWFASLLVWSLFVAIVIVSPLKQQSADRKDSGRDEG